MTGRPSHAAASAQVLLEKLKHAAPGQLPVLFAAHRDAGGCNASRRHTLYTAVVLLNACSALMWMMAPVSKGSSDVQQLHACVQLK